MEVDLQPHFRNLRVRPTPRAVLPQSMHLGDNNGVSKDIDFDALDADAVAKLLKVSTRQVSTYVKEKGLPCHTEGRQRTFVGSEVFDWYVGYKNSIDRYAGESASGGEDDDPIRRKDAAVADLKELDLQQRRGQLVPMADVARVLQDVSKGLQVEILGLPTRIVGPALACRERNELFTFLSAECSQLCTRLSQLRFDPKAAAELEPDEDDE